MPPPARRPLELGLEAAELTSYFFAEPVERSEINRLKRRAALLGLDISAGAVANDFGHPPDSDETRRQMESFRTWIDHFADLGAPAVRVFASKSPPAGATAEQRGDNARDGSGRNDGDSPGWVHTSSRRPPRLACSVRLRSEPALPKFSRRPRPMPTPDTPMSGLDVHTLAAALRAEAVRIGFYRVGIAPALPPPHHEAFRHWLTAGRAGVMHDWLARHEPLRSDPAHLLAGARSVIVLATDYPADPPAESVPGRGRVARYARGDD